MQINWEMESENLTLFVISTESEHFRSTYDSFGSGIIFNLQIEPRFGMDKRDLLAIGGEIIWKTDNLNDPSTLIIPVQPFRDGTPLMIPISNELLYKIEAVRNAGPVTLQVSLHGYCNIPVNLEWQSDAITKGLVEQQMQWLRGRTTVIRSKYHSYLSIHREKWAELLKGMGGPSYRLVEIPSLQLKSRQEKRWEEVLDRYENMLNKQRLGNFEECIQESRLVVEKLVFVLASHFGLSMGDPKKSGDVISSFRDKFIQNFPSQKNNIDSFVHLLRAIAEYSNLYHHAGDRPSLFGVLRERSTYIVMMCSAALYSGAKMMFWIPSE